MNQSQLDKLCNEILTSIEVREASLLNWGFINVRSDLESDLPGMLQDLHPLAHVLWEEAEQGGVTVSDILDNLRERRLIFQGQDNLYRTRFAEAVRLTCLLRQRFSHDDWQSASRLVSDMRIHLQRRRYPERNIPVSELLSELGTQRDLHVSTLHTETITRLLQEPDGSSLSLARFQKEAILQQFRNLQIHRDRALVIGAGTGAGKTKAFYIPALAYIADVMANNVYATQALAIYPRVELLKDQLTEIFAEARKLDLLLKSHGKREIVLGAYYGDTPRAAKDFFADYTPPGWQQTRDKIGWVCPFFSCPNDSNHTLIWEQADLQQEKAANERGQYGKYARLRCQSCSFEINAEQLLLTREQMIRCPPDILFTTTEMLNRRLSRPNEHVLFGIDTPTPPRMVLLDEIHTYEGLAGAQVAYLLRRWRHARGYNHQKSLCIVGLSATLAQAESSFAKLTGIPVYEVGYIFPRDEDLIEEGLEYNLVLKGDPVSGTSLLSTSVQTAMLLGRIMDNDRNPVSHGAYGQRIFAFTDNLDVINRWYHIQYDAEKIKTLSQYREVAQTLGLDERRRRNEMGQDWQICKLLGHELKAPLRLERTTSQDRGVSANADLVIATSTLEVGFNDPAVGAIIQHKAPRSLASFVQRKGRAGRDRRMRPWMVVVTSAYGRDRWAFQHAESLFDPLLPPIDLPIENYYIRKVQAAYALMDWLSLVLKTQDADMDVWNLLSNDQGKYNYRQKQRQLVCNVLRSVLDGTLVQELENYLEAALGIQDDETAVLSLMWSEPRPLLLEVIPTLLRQLETNWQCISDSKPQPWQDFVSANPMPEFVPSTLFSDLNLLEARLHIPDSKPKSKDIHEGHDEFMSLPQALTEFAPGRVSKRFAQRYAINEAHWLALPDDAQISRNVLSLQYLKVERDRIPKRVKIGNEEYLVYRPLAYILDLVPSEVRSTSYAQLIWESHFEPKHQRVIANPSEAATNPDHNPGPATGIQLALSPDSKWKQFLQSIEVFTQVNDSWVEVTRLGVGVHVDTRYHEGGSRRRTLYFEDPVAIGQPAAIGFSLDVDALRFSIEPINVQQLVASAEWSKLYYHLGPYYFLHKLQNDPRLAEAGLSSFEIEWLWQLELSMLLAVAVARRCTLGDAAIEVQRNRQALADRTMRVIFQSQQVSDDEDEGGTGLLHQKLMDYLGEQAVQSTLSDSVAVLWDSNDSGLPQWLENCYASSLGAVLFAAVTRLVPDVEPDDLLMDVDGNHIWISEVAAGGVGLISKIADAIAQRPRAFELQLLDTLQHCDREQLATGLREVAILVERKEPDLQQAFWQARNQTDLLGLAQTRQLLTKILETNAIPATRQLIVAVNSKFLRPNSDQDTDELIAMLVNHWEQEQARLGCAIDLRVMSVAARKIDEVEQQVQRVLQRIGGTNTLVDENQIFNLLQSLLWLGCVDSCPDCVEKKHPYQQLARPSRALLLTLLNPHVETINYEGAAWQSRVEQVLASKYQAQLGCDQSNLLECKKSLLTLLVTPIDIGFQSFFPIVERIDRAGQQWVIHLAIRELIGN